ETEAPKQGQMLMIEKIECSIREIHEKLGNSIAKECEYLAAFNKIDEEVRKYSNQRNGLVHWGFKRTLRWIFSGNPELALDQVLEIKKAYAPDVNGKVVVNAFQLAK